MARTGNILPEIKNNGLPSPGKIKNAVMASATLTIRKTNNR